MNLRDAKCIAFGSRQAASLEEYYSAWQWLYDNQVTLSESDINYLEKLICDGVVIPSTNDETNQIHQTVCKSRELPHS